MREIRLWCELPALRLAPCPSNAEDEARSCGRHHQRLRHRHVHGHDHVHARAVHGDDVVGIDVLEDGHGLGHDVVGRGRQMEAADDRVNLLDSGHLLRVTDRVDHARVAARRDDDEAAVLHVIDGGMLALEGISDELARLRLDARRTEVARGACGIHWPGHEPRGGRRLLEIGDPSDLAGDEGVAGDRGRLLREHDLEAARLQGGTIERAVVYGSRRGDNDAMTEGVLAASIERDAGLELALRDAGEIGQRSVVIEVTVTYDESVGVRRIDLQETVVVEEGALGGREVQEDLAPLTAAHGVQMVCEPVLEQQQPLGVERRPLNGDGVELAAPGEGVVDVVTTLVSTSRSTVGGALICATAGSPPSGLIPPKANVTEPTAPSLSSSRRFMATPCLSGTSASPPSGRQTLLEIRHAATAVCWLSTAAILRQPSILRNLICPLATRLKSKVNSSPGFTDQPKVINGCSDLMVEVFGEAIGKHARSAVGMAELPLNIPVEVEMIVEVEPR